MSVDVRLPAGVALRFRVAAGRRVSALMAEMVAEFVEAGPAGVRVPVTSAEDRRVTVRLAPAAHVELVRLAGAWGVPLGGLLRLVVEQGLQRRGQL